MPEQNRRSFLRWTTHGLGLVFAAVLGVPAVAYLIDGRNRKSPPRDFRPVDGIDLTELTEVGAVRQGVIRAVRRDAWTLYPNDVIGRVWVVREGPNPQDLSVFTTICPHLGCSVNLNTGGGGFTCPCHGGRFGLDGARVGEQNPAPRGMDTLEWRVDPTDANRVLVKYQNFRQMESAKIVKT